MKQTIAQWFIMFRWQTVVLKQSGGTSLTISVRGVRCVMSRYIDADALIADMQERYCKPCKEKGEDYNEARCRACWVDDAMGDVDGFGDSNIEIIRCGECKKTKDDFIKGDKLVWCGKWKTVMGVNEFCSRGERREP